jgi:hypothetical protein
MLNWGRSRYIDLSSENSLHKMSNDNRMRLIHFASSRNMVVGSTMFEHKDIHKRTWTSPDGNMFNQIDHILIDIRHCSDLRDIRSYRGGNIDSDHYLIISKIRSRISNARKMHGFLAKKFICGKLVEQGVATRHTGKIAEYLADFSDSECVSRAWEYLRDIVNADDVVLERIERVKGNNLFDEECEQVTNLKNPSI